MPASTVLGVRSGASALAFTERLTRGSEPQGSRSSSGCAGHVAAPETNAASIARTRAAYASASAIVRVFSPRRSTVVANPAAHSAPASAVAAAGSSPPMNCSAIRRMPKRAPARASREPNGTTCAVRRPARTIPGVSSVSTYSSRWLRTSSADVQAGNTSTKRKSPVLKCGRAVAQRSMWALRSNVERSRVRASGAAAATIWRASVSTSFSRTVAMTWTVPAAGAAQTDHPRRDALEVRKTHLQVRLFETAVDLEQLPGDERGGG